MTDPAGRSFLSYRRSRAGEAKLLIEAQRDLGIPTWQDLRDLEEKPTADELERVIAAPETASAVLWLTPEVESSETIRKLEAPCILRRAREEDGFFLVPVAAGGLGYEEAAAVLDPCFSPADLRHWNLRKVDGDPIGPAEAAEVAARVLDRRLAEIHRRRPAGEPLKLLLHTRSVPAFEPGIAVVLDWTHRFEGKAARAEAWSEHLLPALGRVAGAIERKAPSRGILASGKATLPAVAALGCAFLAPRRIPIAWEQYCEDQTTQIWSLAAAPEPSGFAWKMEQHDVGARDLAVLVAVSDQVEAAFSEVRPGLKLRAVVTISKPGGTRHQLTSAGQAAHVAHLVRDAVREARSRFQQIGCVHLFMAVPAGLAMMIGQLLNTWGAVQTYEHVRDGDAARYEPAALLRPMS